MGARLHYFILDYIKDLEGVILEIGASNGDGSTDFYSGLVCGIKRLKFYSVDMQEIYFNRANDISKKSRNVKAFLMTGEHFLSRVFPRFNEKICYAYLDNYDWNGWQHLDKSDWPEWVIDIEKEYTDVGLPFTQHASATAHLEQTKLILKHVSDKCLIQFDDTYGTEYNGKGQYAIPYLLNLGWNVVCAESGTVILSNYKVKEKS